MKLYVEVIWFLIYTPLSQFDTLASEKKSKQRAEYFQKQDDILSQENKAKARARYKADPEKKKVSVRDRYKADSETKKASVRESYKANPEKKKAVRDSYKADPEKKKAKQSAKRQRYQEDVEENRAAKRHKYEDNSAAIKASERNRYWNDPAVRLAKHAAERTQYRRPGVTELPLPPKVDLNGRCSAAPYCPPPAVAALPPPPPAAAELPPPPPAAAAAELPPPPPAEAAAELPPPPPAEAAAAALPPLLPAEAGAPLPAPAPPPAPVLAPVPPPPLRLLPPWPLPPPPTWLSWPEPGCRGTSFENAYLSDVEPSTGHWNDVTATKVIECISECLLTSKCQWIGMTSGGVEGMRRQWNAKYQEMDYIARVYFTTSDVYCPNAKRSLIAHYGLKSDGGMFDNENSGAGGNLGSDGPFVVYLVWKNVVTGIPFDNAYRSDVEPSRGHWNETATEMIQRIDDLLRGSNNRWIGITSDGKEGIRRRWNAKYRELKMKHIAWVYSTDSDKYRQNAESDLTHHYHLKSETDEEDRVCPSSSTTTVVSSPDRTCHSSNTTTVVSSPDRVCHSSSTTTVVSSPDRTCHNSSTTTVIHWIWFIDRSHCHMIPLYYSTMSLVVVSSLHYYTMSLVVVSSLHYYTMSLVVVSSLYYYTMSLVVVSSLYYYTMSLVVVSSLHYYTMSLVVVSSLHYYKMSLVVVSPLHYYTMSLVVVSPLYYYTMSLVVVSPLYYYTMSLVVVSPLYYYTMSLVVEEKRSLIKDAGILDIGPAEGLQVTLAWHWEVAVHWCQRHKLLSDSKMCPKCGTDMRLVKRKGTNPEDMVAWHTAVDWYSCVWDVCAQNFVDHPAVMGGQGVEVRIDESKFGKREYLEEWRGQLVNAFWWKWNRDAATLLPVIQQFVRPGSIVYCDKWS
eukprot:Em0003g461a